MKDLVTFSDAEIEPAASLSMSSSQKSDNDNDGQVKEDSDDREETGNMSTSTVFRSTPPKSITPAQLDVQQLTAKTKKRCRRSHHVQ